MGDPLYSGGVGLAVVLIVLVLGGSGRLYGGLIGAVIYMVLQDWLSKLQPTIAGHQIDGPQFWQFGVGLLLVLTVLFARRGLLGLIEDAARRLMPERRS